MKLRLGLRFAANPKVFSISASLGTICVQSGTTTELNLTDQVRARNITFEPVVFEEIDPTYTAYDEGRCDAVTSDKSQLIARRQTFQTPDDHVVLDVTLSTEPLGLAVMQRDSQWRDIISWVVYATIQAEEFGIDSNNIDTFLATEDPQIKRFVGTEGELGSLLGLPNDFAVNVVKSVGNYYMSVNEDSIYGGDNDNVHMDDLSWGIDVYTKVPNANSDSHPNPSCVVSPS